MRISAAAACLTVGKTKCPNFTTHRWLLFFRILIYQNLHLFRKSINVFFLASQQTWIWGTTGAAKTRNDKNTSRFSIDRNTKKMPVKGSNLFVIDLFMVHFSVMAFNLSNTYRCRSKKKLKKSQLYVIEGDPKVETFFQLLSLMSHSTEMNGWPLWTDQMRGLDQTYLASRQTSQCRSHLHVHRWRFQHDPLQCRRLRITRPQHCAIKMKTKRKSELCLSVSPEVSPSNCRRPCQLC